MYSHRSLSSIINRCGFFYCVQLSYIVNEMVISVKINKKKMYELANVGYTTATDLADWMVKDTVKRLT